MTTSPHTQQTLKLIAGHLTALQEANQAGDPRFAADVLADIRKQAKANLTEKTRAGFEKLAEQINEQRTRAQKQIAELDANASAADLVRRGQAWDRVQRLLDAAGHQAGSKLGDIMRDIGAHLPGDDPVVVLQAILENGPVYAAANAQKAPGLPDPAEIVEEVRAQLAEQAGPVGEAYRARIAADADGKLVETAGSLTSALTEGQQPGLRDLTRLYQADQNLYQLAWSAATGSETVQAGADAGQ